MARRIVVALAAFVALIQGLSFLAATFMAREYAVGLGLLAAAAVFAWIGRRSWHVGPWRRP